MLFFDSACDGSAKLRNFPRGGADQLQRRVAYICEEMSRKIVDLAEMILEKRSGSADWILGKHVLIESKICGRVSGGMICGG